MPGSEIVCANMIIWESMNMQVSAALMRAYVMQAQQYAMFQKPWHDRTGSTLYDFYNYTSTSATRIESEIGYRSAPSHEGSKGWWLENPNANVHAYNRTGPAFGDRFKILERAIESDVGALFSSLTVLWTSSGLGVPWRGTSGGNIGLH